MLTGAIHRNNLRIHPLAPTAAQLLVQAYRHWERGHEIDWGGWSVDHREWSNVQVSICSRPISAADWCSNAQHALEGMLECRAGRRSPMHHVVVVPGTNQVRDWGANLHPIPIRIGGLPGWWRRGFALGGEWIWSQVRPLVRPGDRVLLTGHSYGAAMAQIAAAYAARDGLAGHVSGVLPWASPRVGSGEAAGLLSKTFPAPLGQRFVLGFDVVPWAVIPLGWHHALEALYIGGDGRARTRYRFWAELRSAIRRRGFQPISDHWMGNYERWCQVLAAPRLI